MGRPSNTEERRRQIVHGLEEVLAAGGMRAATTQAIAQAAGLTPGLVHYHFKRKREVLLALIEELERRLAERAAARTPGGAGARASLEAFLDATSARGSDEDLRAVACWVAIAAEAAADEEVREVFDAAMLRQQNELKRMILSVMREESGSADEDEATRVATALLSNLLGAFLLATAAPRVAPEGFAAPSLRRVLDALLPPAGGRR